MECAYAMPHKSIISVLYKKKDASIVYTNGQHQIRVTSSTNGYCAFNAIWSLVYTGQDKFYEQNLAYFKTLEVNERGGLKEYDLLRICDDLRIPVFEASQFYDYISDKSFSLLAGKNGLDLLPSLIYDKNHVFIVDNPRDGRRKIDQKNIFRAIKSEKPLRNEIVIEKKVPNTIKKQEIQDDMALVFRKISKHLERDFEKYPDHSIDCITYMRITAWIFAKKIKKECKIPYPPRPCCKISYLAYAHLYKKYMHFMFEE